MDLTILLVMVVFIISSMYWAVKKPKHLPPSPGIALPIVGHLYLMERDPRQQFKKWAQKLGDVFSLKLGQETVVVLNTFDAIKEAFVKLGDSFSDRPETAFVVRNVPHMDKGLTLSSGEYWKEQRTVTLSILKKFGLGKNSLVEMITENVNAFINEIAKENGRPMKIRGIINVSVSNIICSIIFGQKFEFNDPKFKRLIVLVNDFVRLNSGVSRLNFLPFLKYLPKYKRSGEDLVYTAVELREFSTFMVKEISRNYNPNNHDNYILDYVHEIEKRSRLKQSTNLDEMSLIRNIENLFAAGTETTSSTILWSLYFILHNPHIQSKIYQEITEYVGLDRAPNISDKPQLKYLNAFIMETQRMGSLVPFGITHVCAHDTVLKGFTIPRGAQVIPNLDAVLKDEKIWGDPENFRPERFLDEQGNFIKREELIPFSMGRRKCLGESLVKMELFLFLSSMFQRFEFLRADPCNPPAFRDIFGLVVSPAPFDIRCVERRQ